MTPRPPSWASAIAMAASVTVSIGELRIGTCILMRAVSRLATSTSEGTTVLYRGAMRTSSNVRPVAMNLSARDLSSIPHSLRRLGRSSRDWLFLHDVLCGGGQNVRGAREWRGFAKRVRAGDFGDGLEVGARNGVTAAGDCARAREIAQGVAKLGVLLVVVI